MRMTMVGGMILGLALAAGVAASCDDATNDNPPLSGAGGQVLCITQQATGAAGTSGATAGAGGTGGTMQVGGAGTSGNEAVVACSGNGGTGIGIGAGAGGGRTVSMPVTGRTGNTGTGATF